MNNSVKTEGVVINGVAAKTYGLRSILNGSLFIYQRALEIMDLTTTNSILDLGCGNGTQLFLIRKKVGQKMKLTGVDPSEDMIDIARKKNDKKKTGIEFFAGAGEDLLFENESFDWVISSLTFHHLPKQIKKETLQNIFRVLKTNGHLLISDFGVVTTLFGKVPRHFLKKHAYVKENLDGILVPLLKDAGFRKVRVAANQFGIIQHIEATK